MIGKHLEMSRVSSELTISTVKGKGVAAGGEAAKHAVVIKQIPNTVNKCICGGNTLIRLICPIAEEVALEEWRHHLSVLPRPIPNDLTR